MGDPKYLLFIIDVIICVRSIVYIIDNISEYVSTHNSIVSWYYTDKKQFVKNIIIFIMTCFIGSFTISRYILLIYFIFDIESAIEYTKDIYTHLRNFPMRFDID
jgi:hypothetical protein